MPKAPMLRDAMAKGVAARAVGVGDGLSALLATRHEFDALWASGLGISAAHGLPDASILSMTDFIAAARSIERSTPLPVIADADTGFGDIHTVMHMVREYEQAGIAAVCIEDQSFPKRNSFSNGQMLVDPREFACKVRAAKCAQSSPDLVVIARTEALIAGRSLEEAFYRASCYEDAGADAILIHSKAATGDEVLSFAERWFQSSQARVPLIAVPTTYYHTPLSSFSAAGFCMVIYANQALRAACRAVDDIFAALSSSESTAEIEDQIATVPAVLDLLGMSTLAEVEAVVAKDHLVVAD